MFEYEKKRMNVKSTKDNLFSAVFCGVISSFAFILILSVIFSSVSLKFKNPIRFSDILSVVSIISGGLSGGIVSSTINKNNPILSSLISSFFVSLIILIIGLLGKPFNATMLINPLILISCSLSMSLLMKSKGKNQKVKKYLNR